MDTPEAERCLRNIARLVRPGGYLCVGGIDVDVRSRVAHELGWTPIQELLEQIHEGDPVLRNDWPFHYAGLEPLDKNRDDWNIRYAAVFRIGTAEKPVAIPEKQRADSQELLDIASPARK
jgi:hypothetical protein